MRTIYSILLLLATPLIVARLIWRGIWQRGYWRHWRERFGAFPQPPLKRAIWLHAVSVGEMRATQPLVYAMRAAWPNHPILVSCMTPTGRVTAMELYGNNRANTDGVKVTCVYLPYDLAILHRRLIAHFDPAILLLMETEIWPNLLVACCNKKIPAMLLNARMSQKSQRGYARFAPVRALTRNALRSLCGVAAQSEGDAQRFTDLGATNVSVTGNVKFDIAVDLALVAQGQRWRQEVAGTRQVLLAASTRDGEEALLLDAYCRVFLPAERAGVLLIIVPRHPARFDAVESLIRARGLDAGRRGVQQTGNACDVWLGDSMGEMPAYIAMCDLAFIGGSLLPLGGHNLIEACAQGKTVLMGPSTFNFAEAARLATAAGAMQQVADADAVMAAAKALLGDEHLQLTASRAALAFARAHAGATGKTMALINPLLAALPTANQPN